MKTTDFSKNITSGHLSETLEKQFGARVDLNKYNREELEDLRNKFRTKLSQQETVANFNDLLTNETYQKDRAILQLLNTRIKEMLGEDIKKLRDKMDELSEAKKGTRPPKTKISPKGSKPDFLDMDKDGDKKEPMKKAVADKKEGPKKGVNPFAKKDKSVEEGFPTVADAKARADKEKTTGKFDKKETGTGTQYTRKSSTFSDGGDDKDVKAAKKKAKSTAEAKDDGKKFDPLKHVKNPTAGEKAAAKDVKRGRYADRAAMLKSAENDGRLKESNTRFKHNVRFVNESLNFLLNEDEEGKAKAITAAGDMVNDFTSWMQRVGQYQTKTMIELADAIKADFGAAESETFKQAVGPALSATLEVLTQQRETVSNAVAVLAGEAVPEEPMGMEPDMGTDMGPEEPGMDMAAPDEMNPEPVDDEFGASDAAAGMGTTGREMRESKFARNLAESHSIMSKLSK